MGRIQLALNVSDVDEAVTFYSDMFGTAPHKRRSGYANFVVEDPPLKLVLIETTAAPGGSINHLGVEVASVEEVQAAISHLERAGLATDVREEELCCHAVQSKVWVTDPDGAAWEFYTILDDEPAPVRPDDCCGTDRPDACCVPATA